MLNNVSVLASPFRLFFLSAGAYAVMAVAAWWAFLFAGWPLPLGWAPMQWHSHEMLYGFVSAAVAGFLLTAMANWTGAPALNGWRLLLLWLLWLAGRVGMWFAAWLPAWGVSIVNLAFFAVLACYVAWVLLQHQNRRNLPLVGVLIALFAGQLVMQIGLATGQTGLLELGQVLGFDVIALLIVIIAGRITPAFSANWLRNQGRDAAEVRRLPAVEFAAPISVVVLLLAQVAGLTGPVMAAVVGLAALLNGIRLWGWHGWKTLGEPLLWILHLAYLALVLGLLARSAALMGWIAPSVWQHLWGLGAIGGLILGVMTRVAVGHTGRPLRLLPLALSAYWAVMAAALLRVLVAAGWLDFRLGVSASAGAWMLAFGLFVLIYSPVLTRSRVDGKPG